MSIMKGKLRRSAVVVAFSLGAFQALSIVGANVASAAALSCTFSGGVLTVEFHGGTALVPHTISQDAIGNILVDGVRTSLSGVRDMLDLARRNHRQYDADQHQRHARGDGVWTTLCRS